MMINGQCPCDGFPSAAIVELNASVETLLVREGTVQYCTVISYQVGMTRDLFHMFYLGNHCTSTCSTFMEVTNRQDECV